MTFLMTYYVTDETVSADLYRVAAGGEIDLHARSGLEQRIDRAVESGARLVALDMSDATFVDSTAVRTIFDAHARLQALDRRLEIVCANRNVLRILQITGLSRAVLIHDSWEDAFGSPAGSEGVTKD
jgi:anti-anti-sigma factor